MPRTPVLLALVVAAAVTALGGCDSGSSKVKEIGKKIDDTVDRLDKDEAGQNLAAARETLAAGNEPSEPCSWAASATATNAAASAKPAVDELRKLCSLDVPLQRATRAVTQAEAARAEQPQAPSLTECSSDEWPKAKTALDRDHPGEVRWTDLKARWAKVCPGA